MKSYKRITIFMSFLALLLFPALNPSLVKAAQTKSFGMKSIEKMEPNGEFDIFLLKDRVWQEAGNLKFDKYFREQEIDLSRYLSGSGKVKMRLVQKGGGAAHIDSISLGGASPEEVNGIRNDLLAKKLSMKDYDVIDAFQKSFEFIFPAVEKNKTVSLTARIEGKRISEIPFQFPSKNLYKEMDSKSKFYTYKLNNEKDSPVINNRISVASLKQPFFKEYSPTGSGHPSGFTYGWVTNDDSNLYVKMDFTPDNTLDGNKDYAKVYVKTDKGLTEFKISESHAKWGSTDFTYTDRVVYQHKVYNFKIPLKEIGIEKIETGRDILLAFAAYGTASPPFSCDEASSIQSRFNMIPIAADNYIWFNSIVRIKGMDFVTGNVTIHLIDSEIKFNGMTYAVPDSTVVFSPMLTESFIVFTGTDWFMAVPLNYAGNVFLSGMALQVPFDGLPGGVNPVIWSGTFMSDTPGITIEQEWAAAVYTQFSSDYSLLGIKPVDGDTLSDYENLDPAGTPEDFKLYVIGGATGNGETNYTGSYSDTSDIRCHAQTILQIPVDIHPTSCPNPFNVSRPNGILPAAILGTDDFDVTQIDPATVRLSKKDSNITVAPLRWAIEDVATPYEPYVGKVDCNACTTKRSDGYTDLTLKFDTKAVADLVGDVNDRDCLPLTIQGNLKEEFGAALFIGEDVMKIIKKK